MMASFSVRSCNYLCWRVAANRSSAVKSGLPTQHRNSDPQVAQSRVDGVLEKQPHLIRIELSPPEPAMRASGSERAYLVTRPSADDPDDVFEEVHHDRSFGTQLRDGRECGARVVTAKEELPHDQ